MACACRSVPEVCCSRIALVLHTRLDLSWKIHNAHNMTTNSHTHHILSHYYLCANLRSTVILLKSVLQGCHCLMSCFHVQPDTSIMMRGLYTRASFLQHKDNPPMVLPSTINLTNTSTSNPPSYHHSQPIPHCTSTDTAHWHSSSFFSSHTNMHSCASCTTCRRHHHQFACRPSPSCIAHCRRLSCPPLSILHACLWSCLPFLCIYTEDSLHGPFPLLWQWHHSHCEFLEIAGAPWLVQGISGGLDLLKEELIMGQFICVVVQEVG